jgi:hypothetical protein
MTKCSVVTGQQRFRGPSRLTLHPEDGGSYNTERRHNPEHLDLKYHRRESLKILINSLGVKC